MVNMTIANNVLFARIDEFMFMMNIKLLIINGNHYTVPYQIRLVNRLIIYIFATSQWETNHLNNSHPGSKQKTHAQTTLMNLCKS